MKSTSIDPQPVAEVEERVTAILPQMIELRHDLHRHPELALQEIRTSAHLRTLLSTTPITLWPPLLGTDVIGELPGASPSVLCLRADIDAIAGEEQSGVPYASQHAGLMHACGHDGHTAMLAGAALVLSDMQTYLPMTVRFIFQPGEEMRCAGRELVARGACRDADAAFALHGWPGLPVGTISSRAGTLLAAGIEFRITFHGVGCHGAMPERGHNPIPPAAAMVSWIERLYQQVRSNDGVISACTLHAGTQANIIPDTAQIEGTMRYLDADLGESMVSELTDAAHAIAREYQVDVNVHLDRSYDLPTRNTPLGYGHLRHVVDAYMPDAVWQDAARPSLVMEDFAFYLVEREGAMAGLGLGEGAAPLHSPAFDFPDVALPIGIRLFCLTALAATP
jgi:amidohydrolase